MIVGRVVSTRLTLNVQFEELPATSVTVIVIAVVPTPDTAVPIAGDCVTVSAPVAVQLSLFVTSER